MRSDELERELGRRFRDLRVAKRLTQAELAEQANVSIGALQHLEGGSGSTTTTLAKVLRALGEERWIEALGPAPAQFNPLELLDAPEGRARPIPGAPGSGTGARPRELSARPTSSRCWPGAIAWEPWHSTPPPAGTPSPTTPTG